MAGLAEDFAGQFHGVGAEVRGAEEGFDFDGTHAAGGVEDGEVLCGCGVMGLFGAPEGMQLGDGFAGLEVAGLVVEVEDQVVVDGAADVVMVQVAIEGGTAAPEDNADLVVNIDPRSAREGEVGVAVGGRGDVAFEGPVAGVPEEAAAPAAIGEIAKVSVIDNAEVALFDRLDGDVFQGGDAFEGEGLPGGEGGKEYLASDGAFGEVLNEERGDAVVGFVDFEGDVAGVFAVSPHPDGGEDGSVRWPDKAESLAGDGEDHGAVSPGEACHAAGMAMKEEAAVGIDAHSSHAVFELVRRAGRWAGAHEAVCEAGVAEPCGEAFPHQGGVLWAARVDGLFFGNKTAVVGGGGPLHGFEYPLFEQGGVGVVQVEIGVGVHVGDDGMVEIGPVHALDGQGETSAVAPAF